MKKFFGLVVGIVITLAGTSARIIPVTIDPQITPLNSSETKLNLTPAPLVNNLKQTETEVRFQRVMQYALEQKLSERSMGEIMQAIAGQFLGARYKAGLLDRADRETLVVSLEEFDCVLFVETVLAIARGVAVRDYGDRTFSDRLLQQRYRNGELDGYCSRLHYFSEWIADNQNRGNVENITREIGGITINKKLNFISRNRHRYRQLANNNSNYQCFVAMEAKLERSSISYIPKNQIRRAYDRLQPGDIIAIATRLEGLDVSHTGLVYQNPNGSKGLIHASLRGTVRIAPDLHGYVGNVNNAIGIIVARPKNPRN